jgi:hypothetical protein
MQLKSLKTAKMYMVIDENNEAKYSKDLPILKQGERLFVLQEDGNYMELSENIETKK